MSKSKSSGISYTKEVSEAHMFAGTDLQARFFDLAGILMVALDRNGRIALINQEGCQLLGLTQDELLGMDWFHNFIPGDQREKVREVFDLVMSGRVENIEAFENKIITAQGRERLVFWKNSNLRKDTGEILYTFSSGLDITEHREMEKAARENEERFLQLAENIEEVFWIVSPDWSQVHYVSPGYERLWGQPCEELYRNALAWLEGVHVDDRAKVEEAMQQNTTVRAQEPVFPEYRIVKPDGSVRTVMAKVFPVRDADGKIYRMAGTVLDITDWKTATNALEASEQRLKHFAENARDMVFRWRFDPVEGYEYLSPSTQRITGISPEALYKDPGLWRDHIHPDDRELVFQLLGQIRSGDMPSWEGAYRWQGRDGKTHWMEGSFVPVLDPGGRVIAMDGIVRDVTVRRRGEEALLESEEHYRSLFDQAAVGVAISEPEKRKFLWVNQKISQMLGYTRQELTEISFIELTHPEDRELTLKKQGLIEAGAKHLQYEKRYIGKDGSIVWIRLNLSPFKLDERGAVSQAIVIMEDITEHKMMEARMQHSQKLESLGVLAGGIAHDFNNILMAILGNASLARNKVPEGSEPSTYLEKVLQAAQHAADLTNQMLAYSGKGHFQVAPLELNETLEDMRSLLETVIPKKIRFNLEMMEGLPAIMADGAQIRQVVMNLITNAADAIGDRTGTIRAVTGLLTCDRQNLQSAFLGEDLKEGDYVYLEVSDDGCGMSDEIIERIFEPFFTAKDDGRGLGLAAILGILRGHGGAVEVSSRVGEGSTFRILLPASDRAVEAAGEREVEHKPSAKEVLVLLVDDDDMVLNVTRSMLMEAGFEVITAEDGFKAVELFQAEKDRIDVVLMDMSMPEMGGLEASRRMKEMDPTARIVLSSGYTEMDVLSDESAGVVDGFIQKPYRYEDLLTVIEKVLH